LRSGRSDLRSGRRAEEEAIGPVVDGRSVQVMRRETTMSSENKVLLRRLLEEGMANADGSVVDELVSADYVNHDAPVPIRGAEGFKQLAGMFRAAFPDIRITVEDEFAEGDRVGTRGTVTGTHRGEFMGVPATGRSVAIEYLDLWRVEDGKFVENWVKMDMMGLMQQLGVVPGAGAAH
jgi:steroid delta-isomerase-like uncharacterized protein